MLPKIPSLNMNTGGGDLTAGFGAGGNDSVGNGSTQGGGSAVNTARINVMGPNTTGVRGLDLALDFFKEDRRSIDNTRLMIIGGGVLATIIVGAVVYKVVK